MKKYYEWAPGIYVTEHMMKSIHDELTADGECNLDFDRWLGCHSSEYIKSKWPIIRARELIENDDD